MITLSPAKPAGTIAIPASKSQTIRAFLIAYFAHDISRISNPLISEDTKSCINAISNAGAKVMFSDDMSSAIVDSRNIVLPDNLTIDAGNSGTTTYLLLPMAASLGIPVTITGDEQLLSRPIKPLADALRSLGCDVDSDKLPVTVKGPIKGGMASIECRTSQYLSGLLLGAPLAEENTGITCTLLYEKPYVSLTLGWLREQGVDFSIADDYMRAEVRGGQRYHGFESYINGDYSSASFFFCMAAMAGTSITVKGLDPADPQGDKAILTDSALAPVATLTVTGYDRDSRTVSFEEPLPQNASSLRVENASLHTADVFFRRATLLGSPDNGLAFSTSGFVRADYCSFKNIVGKAVVCMSGRNGNAGLPKRVEIEANRFEQCLDTAVELLPSCSGKAALGSVDIYGNTWMECGRSAIAAARCESISVKRNVGDTDKYQTKISQCPKVDSDGVDYMY